jgi:hypothetical protein
MSYCIFTTITFKYCFVFEMTISIGILDNTGTKVKLYNANSTVIPWIMSFT